MLSSSFSAAAFFSIRNKPKKIDSKRLVVFLFFVCSLFSSNVGSNSSSIRIMRKDDEQESEFPPQRTNSSVCV